MLLHAHNQVVLTNTISIICSKLMSWSAATHEGSLCVGTDVTTATVVGVAFIDIWKEDGAIILWNIIGSMQFSIPTQLLASAASWYPDLQLHTKDPGVLVQMWLQPPLLLLHSLMSGMKVDSTICQIWCTLSPTTMYNHCYLPLQLLPSLASTNPALHSHLWDPGWFTHSWAHPPLLLWHSFTSKGIGELF